MTRSQAEQLLKQEVSVQLQANSILLHKIQDYEWRSCCCPPPPSKVVPNYYRAPIIMCPKQSGTIIFMGSNYTLLYQCNEIAAQMWTFITEPWMSYFNSDLGK